MIKKYRSAETGKYVAKDYAVVNPKITVGEKVKSKKCLKKKKGIKK